MKHVSLFLLLLLAGCGKSGSEADRAEEKLTDAIPALRQTAPPGTPAAAAVQAMNQDLMSSDPAANLRVLNQMVEGFTMSHNRRLTDLDELVKMKLISRVPPAPAGKKFAIDSKSGRVILTDQ